LLPAIRQTVEPRISTDRHKPFAAGSFVVLPGSVFFEIFSNVL
jgi:hypothetical protein